MVGTFDMLYKQHVLPVLCRKLFSIFIWKKIDENLVIIQ